MDMKEQERRLEQQTQAEYAEMEATLARTSPGVLDVMKVYGDCDAAMRQADAYFAALDPEPQFSTSNTSGQGSV